MTTERLNIGILGCGAITQFAHASAALRARQVTLAALCDGAPDLLHKVGARVGVDRLYTDFDRMLDDKKVQAVIIAVPDAFHLPLAIRAMRAGKHVLIEKPMGENVEQCLELLRVQRETGVKVQIGSMKRHDPGVAFARKFVRESAGGLLSVSGIYRDSTLRYDMQESCLDPLIKGEKPIVPDRDMKRDRERYNLMTQGSHLFDTLHFLAGRIHAVTAQVAHRDGHSSWHGLLEFFNGARGHFELTCKANADWCEQYTVCGDAGSVDVKVHLPFYHRPAQARCFDAKSRQWRQPLGERSNAYANQLDAFANAIQKYMPTNPDARDGLAAVAVLEAVEQSVRTGQRVDVPSYEALTQ